MSAEIPIEMESTIKDCNRGSRLLDSQDQPGHVFKIDHHRYVPATTANHSLFSENGLLIDQD